MAQPIMNVQELEEARKEGYKVRVYGKGSYIAEISFVLGTVPPIRGFSFQSCLQSQRTLRRLLKRIQGVYPKIQDRREK